jgi:hypothetical protein
MLKSALIGLAFTILLWQPATAQQYQNYLGFGLRTFSEENSDADINRGGDLEASGTQITFGHEFSPSLALELNFMQDDFDSFGVEADQLRDLGVTATVDAETETIGISLIFSAGGTADVIPYFRLGYGTRDASADATYIGRDIETATISLDEFFDSDDGTWFGFGLKIKGTDTFALNIEAAQFADDTTGVYIGPQFYF